MSNSTTIHCTKKGEAKILKTQTNNVFFLVAESAKMAASLGAAGILVSNHGGRQLDGVAATVK